MLNDGKRAHVLRSALEQEITVAEAASRLDLSLRHTRRLLERYRQVGWKGLEHGLRGRPSNRRIDAFVLERALCLYRRHMPGEGPTKAARILRERYGVNVNRETLRRALVRTGLRDTCRARPRVQKPQPFGRDLAVAMPLSSGEFVCLFETTTGLARVAEVSGSRGTTVQRLLRDWTLVYGIPETLILPRIPVFRERPPTTITHELAGIEPVNPLLEACGRLGVAVRFASQASLRALLYRHAGDVERRFYLRLRHELSRRKTRLGVLSATLPATRVSLPHIILPDDIDDCHVPVGEMARVETVFGQIEPVVIGSAGMLSQGGRAYRVVGPPTLLPPCGTIVMAHVDLEDRLRIKWRGRWLPAEPSSV
ncbi:MAG: helix-turn-helix domain-containing protein [Spirochaetota bacterium]